MTRQARYHLEQLLLGKCGRGCGRPRRGDRTTCEPCAQRMRTERRIAYLDKAEDRRQAVA